MQYIIVILSALFLAGCQTFSDSVSSIPATPITQPIELRYTNFQNTHYHRIIMLNGQIAVDDRYSIAAVRAGANIAINFVIESAIQYGHDMKAEPTVTGFRTRYLIDQHGNIRDAVGKNNTGIVSRDNKNFQVQYSFGESVPIYAPKGVVSGDSIAQTQRLASGDHGFETFTLAGAITYRGSPALRLDLDRLVSDTASTPARGYGYMVVDPTNGRVLRSVLNFGISGTTIEAE